VGRVKADGMAAQGAVQGLLSSLLEAKASSQRCVALLADVDTVKQRMEAARDTMGEVSGLAALMDSVEQVRVCPYHPGRCLASIPPRRHGALRVRMRRLVDGGWQVFAGTDLRLMATTLARMRQGLKVVGAVPEFRHGHQRVAALEDRLESAVSPLLTQPLQYLCLLYPLFAPGWCRAAAERGRLGGPGEPRAARGAARAQRAQGTGVVRDPRGHRAVRCGAAHVRRNNSASRAPYTQPSLVDSVRVGGADEGCASDRWTPFQRAS
jgi:hypothetical protein